MFTQISLTTTQSRSLKSVEGGAMNPLFSRFTVSLSLVVLLSAASWGQSVVSDDFNAYNLNTSVWTFTDPLGDANLSLTGTGTSNARLSIAVPGGLSHEPFIPGMSAPAVMQSIGNSDFEFEIKFESPMTLAYQIQGALVREDTNNVIRFDFYSDGVANHFLAATTTDGFASAPSTQIDTSLGSNGLSPLYLRINRTGDTWSVYESTNGTTWNTLGIFTYAISVTKVGVYAGNSGGGFAPAHTAIIDYFFNTSSPIVPEDGVTTITDTTPPLVYDIVTTPGRISFHVGWKTDELATSKVEYGLTAGYELGSVSDPTLRLTHSLTVPGLLSATPYHFRIVSDDKHPSNVTTTGDITTATTSPTPPTIAVWYGNDQPFGKPGAPQRRADILGNVSDPDGMASLSYRLNSGDSVKLSIGPDTRLLSRPGDFKIDIPYAPLVVGPNSVEIRAFDTFGEMNVTTITLTHKVGYVWPTTYTVGWSSAASMQDSAQIVDGKWGMATGGIHPVEPGYDRSIAIGDTTWSDYEVTAQMTINGIDSTAEAFGSSDGGPALGFLFRWRGHTDSPPFIPPITQPKTGYLPLGAIGWYHWRYGFGSVLANQWEMMGNNLVMRDQNTDVLQRPAYGVRYNFKMRVNTLGGTGGIYLLKFWRDGDPEPLAWLLGGEETLADPQTGSFLIVAHHVDVTVGSVTTKALTGDVTPPLFASIVSTPGARSAHITWTTNEVATTKVHFGLTTAYGDSMEVSGTRTSHAVPLAGLTPGTPYHYRVVGADSSGNTGYSIDQTFTTNAAPVASSLQGDEFNSGSLNTLIWTFVNPPPTNASESATATTQSISVPSGTAHDLWTTGYGVPRIMQSVNNTDFQAEVKFTSGVSQAYQAQGIVVEQDLNNVLRFDFSSEGTNTNLFAASFLGGFSSPTVLMSSAIALGGVTPLYMRLKRESDVWSLSYSIDGVTWVRSLVFYQQFTVTKVGLFAGNAGGPPPAHEAVFDYFRTTGAAVNARVFLQGPYVIATGEMRTNLRSVMPLTQPYNTAPWNYPGTETVGSIPADVVDWVLLEVRSGTGAGTKLVTRAGFVNKSGHIVDLDGTSQVSFPALALGSYYLVVHHRNHLAVMSASAVGLSEASALYDFTASSGSFFGGNAGAVQVKAGVWAMVGGNADKGDQDIFPSDAAIVRTGILAGDSGYIQGDIDMDGDVFPSDYAITRLNLLEGYSSQVP
jgi:hypothetical protein